MLFTDTTCPCEGELLSRYIQHNCQFTAGNFQELSKMYKAKAQERVAVQNCEKDPPKMMMVCI